MTTETMEFSADVARLLDIVAHALYTNHDVFLRELISNAADACDRLRYEALQRPDLIKDDPDFKIHLKIDAKEQTLSVVDNGIGMSRAELIENLGTIAKSGTAAMMARIKAQGGDSSSPSLIGQFGVGFYASYMVASQVQVISRQAGVDDVCVWESDGRSGFSVRPASAEDTTHLNGGRGTAVILTIKDQAREFLVEEKVKQTAQHYSDHVNVPIYIGAQAEAINSASALWAKPKNEITPEHYTNFYRALTHGFDEPLMTSHWRAEGAVQFTALLFVPTLRPWDLYDPSRKSSVKLYVRRVFITDSLEALMYPWLRFVRGVIDTEDLPLNISRESLQFNPALNKIRGAVTKRILNDLNKLAQDDRPGFLAFWGQFGAAVKEGLYDAYEHREDIFKICRFRSTYKDGEEFVSLEDYIARMKNGQDYIYYLSGEKVEALKLSPQLEGFRAQGYEVLFLTDTIDDFWLQQVTDYKGKTFKSVTKGDAAIDRVAPSSDEKTADLLTSMKALLKDEVSDVRVSRRLTDSPVCLVAPEDGIDMHMERVLKIHQKYAGESKPVLEINAGHSIFKKLQTMPADSENFENAARLLLDQARIIQGEPVADPAGFARRMSDFILKVL